MSHFRDMIVKLCKGSFPALILAHQSGSAAKSWPTLVLVPLLSTVITAAWLMPPTHRAHIVSCRPQELSIRPPCPPEPLTTLQEPDHSYMVNCRAGNKGLLKDHEGHMDWLAKILKASQSHVYLLRVNAFVELCLNRF